MGLSPTIELRLDRPATHPASRRFKVIQAQNWDDFVDALQYFDAANKTGSMPTWMAISLCLARQGAHPRRWGWHAAGAGLE